MYNKLNNNNFMNKLINRISPETSENRILHAGFSIILMSEEITQTLSGLSSDMIIFILSGSITIYSTIGEVRRDGTVLTYLEPLYPGGFKDIVPGSQCAANLYSNHHDEIADPNTPAWAKTVIVGALGYFIFPMDAVPDLVPGVGYVDDLGVLTAAVSTIAASVTKEHREKAKTKHREYFGD